MKLRILTLFLALILLLTACVPSRPQTPDTAVPTRTVPQQTDSTQQVPPATEGPVQTDPPQTDPPQTEPAETKPPSVLPGGWHVYTDPSQYTPYKPPEALYTRPDSGDFSEFHPRPDLGLVYPYVTNKLYTSHEEGYSYEGGYRYGFVDRTGRILTDGVYIGIRTLINYRYDAYGWETRSQVPLWVVERMGEVTVQHVSSEYGDYSYAEGDELCGVVAMDGSFALPCEFRSVTLLQSGDRMLCVRNWDGRPDFSIYDLKGNLLLTAEDLFGAYMDCDGWSVDFSEGLYWVEANYYNADNPSDERTNTCWYADAEGKRVLGPYRSGSSFSDGLACVSEDGDSYGYIEKSGRWVIRPRYSWSADFENGRANQSIGEKRIVIDKTGRELITCWDGYISKCPCGYQVDRYGSGRNTFYDLDGNVVFSEAGEWNCMAEDLFIRSDDGAVVLHSLRPGMEELRVEGFDFLYRSVAVVDGVFMLGYRGENYDSEKKVFVPDDLSRVYELTASNPLTIEGYEAAYQTYDQMSGERFWILCDGSRWSVYDLDGVLRAEVQTDYPNLIGGRVFEIGELACTYRDLKGNLLFSYPINSED